MSAYFVEFGSAPAGDAAQIVKALRGESSRQIAFFEPDAKRIDGRGELLDPWGTPYRIDISDPEFPKVYSFGQNQTDEGGARASDDIPSWR